MSEDPARPDEITLRAYFDTPPDAAAIHECLSGIDAAREHFQPPFADMQTAAVADRIVAGVDAPRWDEAAKASMRDYNLLDLSI